MNRHPNRLNKTRALVVRRHPGEKHTCDCRKCAPSAYLPAFRTKRIRERMKAEWEDGQP